MLTHDRTGTGPPLLLLHGLGSYRGIWASVVPALAKTYDVIAVDLPGFGDSHPLSRDAQPTPAALADAVVDFCDVENIQRPHVVGNSLGGWVALEMAKLDTVGSVTGLSPAGLWRHGNPAQTQAFVATGRILARSWFPVLWLTKVSRVPVPYRHILDSVEAMARAEDFWAVFNSLRNLRFTGGGEIGVPVTIAWGDRDFVLPRRTVVTDELPAHTRWVDLPGADHVPMLDDPAATVRVIADSAT